jgi:hypothetical protein
LWPRHRRQRAAFSIRRAIYSIDLVGALLEKPRHVEAERFGGLEVDHELELDWGLDGKPARFLAL